MWITKSIKYRILMETNELFYVDAAMSDMAPKFRLSLRTIGILLRQHFIESYIDYWLMKYTSTGCMFAGSHMMKHRKQYMYSLFIIRSPEWADSAKDRRPDEQPHVERGGYTGAAVCEQRLPCPRLHVEPERREHPHRQCALLAEGGQFSSQERPRPGQREIRL